jgi:hypothetical protein
MAVAIHQISPVAHWPLMLGWYTSSRWLRSSILAVLRTPPLSSRVAVGLRCCSWRLWMALMPSNMTAPGAGAPL